MSRSRGSRARAFSRRVGMGCWVVSLVVSSAGFAETGAEGDSPFAGREGEEAAPSKETGDGVDPLQRAREAFLEGRQLMASEEWADAAGAFRIALEARPTAGLHYYLGVCLERQDQPLEARRAYIEARALLAVQPAADVEALLPAAFERVEARLGRLELTSTPKDATVRVDGTTWTVSRAPWLAPGPHVLVAEAPGHEAVHLHFDATAGLVTQLGIVLPRKVASAAPPVVVAPAPRPSVVAAPPPPMDPPPPRSVLPQTMFWSSVAFGVVGAGVGAAGLVWQQDAAAREAAANEELDGLASTDSSACYGPAESLSPACEQLRRAVGEEESAMIVLVGGFAAAGLGVLGAVTSWAIWPNEEFALRGRVGLGSAEVSLEGRF